MAQIPVLFLKSVTCADMGRHAQTWADMYRQIADSLYAKIILTHSLPDMPNLGPLNSAANKDMVSKIWTNGDTII